MSRFWGWSLLVCLLGAGGCGDWWSSGSAPDVAEAPPPELVTAHSEGAISRRSPIRVMFAVDAATDAQVGQEADNPFSFSPALAGKAVWTARNEIEFVPSAELPAGGAWKVTFDLRKVFPSDARAKPFVFDVAVVPQSYWTEMRGLASQSADGKVQQFEGTLKLADVAETAAVEAMLKPKHGSDALTVGWTHSPDGLEHAFVIHGISRTKEASSLEIGFDGAPIGVTRGGTETIEVPGLDQFVLSSSRAELTGDRYIELRFSDPLDAKQNLDGLITVGGRSDVTLVREGSVVKVFAAGAWGDTETVHIERIRNAAGYALKVPIDVTVGFAPMVPAVSFVGKGVILPTSADMTVPIEATNVRAVTVEATRVYEQNVPQFLQVNELDGQNELARVGKVVWSERVPIEGAENKFNRPIRLGLDIKALVRNQPAGLYRLSMRFERGDIVYDCPDDPAATPAKATATPAWDEEQGESSFWDMWGEGEADGAWARRDDPCHPAFYTKTYDHDLVVSRNVIVSDLGLMASQGAGNEVLAVATDLRTAAPVADAKLELLDYQLQTIATVQTGPDGLARLASPDAHPFALVASANGQKSWLRLDRGSSLQMSHFDVGGVAVTEGLKGFLYGERGVWRPGDDIYTTFVLYDETGKLPPKHPVEMELVNPRGQVIDRRTVADSKNGFYRLTTHTPEDAPTGAWLLRVKAGGATFEKSLRVETIMPNRLKIGLEFASDVIKGPDARLQTTLESRWLHGASAAGLDADIQMSLAPRATTFPRLEGYHFDDPKKAFHADPVEVWTGTIGENGKTPVDASLPIPEGAPGMLTGTFLTRVYEPSGAFSVDEATRPVSPHKRYIGIQSEKGDVARGILLTDVDHAVQVVAVSPDGKVGGDGKVALSLQKIQWRWWWEKGEDNLAEYQGYESHTIVAEEEVPLKDGRATWKFQVKYPEWGRYLVTARDVNGTHSTGQIVYIDWPGWAGRAQKDQPGGASVLTVTADHDKTTVGQPVTLSFPVAEGGRALVSLESGSKVVQAAWVTPEPGVATAKYTFEATSAMAPNIYAHVTMIQPHASAKNDAPIRLYGVIPVEVSDPKSKLAPQITTAAKLEPESTAKIEVSEQSGQAMTYTLAVVDEGLLGLTRYQTPDPWTSFNQREALGVRTWDLYDHVIGAYGGALEGLLSIGGDGEQGQQGPQAQAQRFKPMVWYGGPFTLDAGGKATHEVPIPQYVGEVRVMVIAGQNGAFGAAEKSVPVKKPLMVLATLPRVLSPGESVDLPVSVFALEPAVKDVGLTIETDGPVTVASGSRKLRFGAVGDQMATFHLTVGDKPGIAHVRVKAEGGGQTASQEIEIGVRNPGANAIDVVSGVVASGKKWSVTPALAGVAGSNEAWLEVSRVPPLGLAQRLDMLIQYPHGCVEQTTSSAFPQVYLSKLVDLDPTQAHDVDEHVKAAIRKLRSFQTTRGGFGYWPGEEANDYSSTYAGHFLVEAERAGYALPPGMRSSWVSYQKEQANRWVNTGSHADLEQAYRLYTLALAGSPDLGAMNRLKESELSTTARWRLAAAYALAGQKDTARGLVANAGIDVAPWRELTDTFGSDLRDRAMILEALVQLGEDTKARTVAEAISSSLGQERDLSTQETSYALIGLARFAGISAGDWSMSWSLDGRTPVTVKSGKPMARIPLPIGNTAPNLVVDDTGPVTLYTRLVQKGKLPLGTERPSSSGLSLAVTYTTIAGAAVELDKVDHGDDLVAHVTVSNTSGRRLDELALSWLAPSGWEISGLATGSSEDYDYRDVRDDRVYTYFDLDSGKSVTFDVPANASYAGHYYVPPVSVEAMYDPTLHANTAGRWIDIKSRIDG